MKLSDFKGDDALDLLAEMIDPACEIIADREFLNAAESGRKVDCVKIAIRNHKKAVTRILALLNREDPATFEPNFIQLPGMIYEILDDPELLSVFTSHRPKDNPSFGNVTESTGETAKV